MDELLRQHLPMVQKLANMALRRMPASIELDDLVQAGLIGLWQSLGRFDASLGVTFATFADRRIRGAMADMLRANDHLTRAHRQDIKAGEAHEVTVCEWDDIDPPDPAPNPEANAMARQRLQAALDAIDAMPQRLRDVVRLGWESDMTQAEIAAVLGVCPSRVKQMQDEVVKRLNWKLRHH